MTNFAIMDCALSHERLLNMQKRVNNMFRYLPEPKYKRQAYQSMNSTVTALITDKTCVSLTGGVTFKKMEKFGTKSQYGGGGLTQTQICVQNFLFFRNHKLSFPIPQNMWVGFFFTKNV